MSKGVKNDQKPPAGNTEWDWWLKFVGGYTPRQVIAISIVIMIATQTVGAGVLLTLFWTFIGQNNYLTVQQYKEQSQNLTRHYEEKLQDVNKTLTQKYKECQEEIKGVSSAMEGKLNSPTSELSDKSKEFDKQCNYLSTSELSDKLKEVDKRLNSSTSDLSEKLKEVDEGLSKEPEKMENLGFMKLETFGPVLLAGALVEILLMVFMCNMCCSGRKNSNASQPQARSRITQGRTDPEIEPIDTNNNNMAVLCFRDDDETRCENWAKKIVDSPAWGTKPQIKTRVINSVVDVQAIPACKAALVFVNPDEREMIIEDERHHIGRGLRRQAVQRLMDSGVAVFVMIYRDKGSDSLQGGQLYNKRLDQIDEHHQLKKLKAERRIISFCDAIHAHQSQHIVDELKQMFT